MIECLRNFAPDVIVYKAEDGKEYPAFCANPNKGGVENFAAKNYDVDVDRLDKDPHVWGAITMDTLIKRLPN